MPAVAASGGLPTRLGKYEIVSPLAAGGMARIYIARTTGIGSFERHVVLKLITPERANDAIAVQMFLDEARLAASLNHQNVAQVFEVGEDGGIHYLAMEYVHGQDLRALLAKAGSTGTRVPLELALTVVAGAAAGLHHAHERRGPDGVPLGIVHRDVSPSNIMVGLDGSVKLLDFGIAKAAARSIETQSGIIKGKFAYMAPEQCRGRDVDRRSDVFSLGIILYEITTQHRCFRADSDFDTMHRIVTGDVVRPTRLVQGYPQALEAIVMKALAVDPHQRYQSAGALLEAVEAFAVSSRMSLSTMALGRFMREMFGETPEPWLTNTGRTSAAALAPPQKESTVSNTDGGLPPVRPSVHPSVHRAPTAPADVAAIAAARQLQAARTLLDLPRGRGDARGEADGADDERSDPNAAEWNAKSYPTSMPSYASGATLPPGADVRASSPHLRALPVPAQPAPQVLSVAPAGSVPAPLGPAPGLAPLGGGALPVQPARSPFGTQSPSPAGAEGAAGAAVAVGAAQAAGAGMAPATAPSGPFAPGSGSGTGPALPAAPHHGGLASSPGIPLADRSYPRFETPEPSSLSGEELRLKPSRRPLVIGAAVILIVTAVVIAMTIGGSGGTVGGTDGAEPAPPPSQAPVQANAAMPAAPGSGSAATVARPAESSAAPLPSPHESIRVRVVSDPPGADVLLFGKTIGTTPLDTKIEKGTGPAFLTVHRARYHDVTTKVDLTGDVTKEVTLTRIEEPAPAEPAAEPAAKPEAVKAATPAPAPEAQPDRAAEERAQLEAKRLEEQRQRAEAKRLEEQRQKAEARRLEEQRQRAEARKAEEAKRQQATKKPTPCQAPDRYNPFDTSCLGMPGASPTGACPACKDFK